MKGVYVDYLFSKGYFVADCGRAPNPVQTLIALAKLFDIHIISGQQMASKAMITVAERNLGKDVPEAFYRGFPQSVLQLPAAALLLDQLVHYQLYELGKLDEAGHSLFEETFARTAFNEETVPKRYRIVTAAEAESLLRQYVDALLAGTRPLNDSQYTLVLEYCQDFNLQIENCPCKDIAVRLLLDTRCMDYANLISLPDVIRLVEQLQYQAYNSTDIRKLNLKNQDRKLITRVLDQIFTAGNCDVTSCYEKKRLWCGLLHHIHYKPVNEAAKAFVTAMRNKENHSVYSAYERCLENDDVPGAIDALVKGKGATAVLRHLDNLLAHCYVDEHYEAVLNAIHSNNIIVLIQLLMRYSRRETYEFSPRTFRFTRFNKMVVHHETEREINSRTTQDYNPLIDYNLLRARIRNNLAEVCKGKLGKVYVNESMKRMALPLQETSSMGGVGTLPRGSRLPIPADKVIRAFTYWEEVDDIDLSVIGMRENHEQVEFSWRSMSANQTHAITFSGDQRSGYNGGSEFFDVHLQKFRILHPFMQYLIFCNNVYSGTPFSDCVCKAGYMQLDSFYSGEVFEPKAVASSFTINCKSTFAYLFAIDLQTNEVIWLNIARDSNQRIAGNASTDFLWDILNSTKVINVYDFARMLATEVVDKPEEADVIFSDEELTLRDGAEQIRSCDFEKLLSLMHL